MWSGVTPSAGWFWGRGWGWWGPGAVASVWPTSGGIALGVTYTIPRHSGAMIGIIPPDTALGYWGIVRGVPLFFGYLFVSYHGRWTGCSCCWSGKKDKNTEMSSSWNFPSWAELGRLWAELGHLNFQAETELTLCKSIRSKFLKHWHFFWGFWRLPSPMLAVFIAIRLLILTCFWPIHPPLTFTAPKMHQKIRMLH